MRCIHEIELTQCLLCKTPEPEVSDVQAAAVIDWMLGEVAICDGCTTGDCPHTKHIQCVEALTNRFIKEQHE